MGVFINLSNHPSESWSKEQLTAASEYGEIVDIPFPIISANSSEDDIDRLVDDYCSKVQQYDCKAVMVQGEFTFTYRMVNRLKEFGIKAISSCSERKVIEQDSSDGSIIKTSIFRFVRFREY